MDGAKKARGGERCGEGVTFNSVRVNPRPARTRRLYLRVGQRTMGFSLSTGRGAIAAAFTRRALRRRDLRPGCGVVSLVCGEGGRGLGLVYLIKMGADTTLPVLAEIWMGSVVCGEAIRVRWAYGCAGFVDCGLAVIVVGLANNLCSSP